MIKNVKILLLIVVILFLSSCSSSLYIEETEAETKIYIPTPANEYSLKKISEKETIEETKAHHIYEEIKIPAMNELVIGEKQFLTRINYIKNHIDEFTNTEIVVEGMYGKYTSWDNTLTLPMVYRNGPSCCGDDQNGGFYLVNIDETLYKLDDWIVVKGKPYIYEHEDSEGEKTNYLFLLVEDVKVLDTKHRGQEMVND